MQQRPHCHSAERQVKSGFNGAGSRSLQCQARRRRYTPEPNPLGYDDKTREAALKLYIEGSRPPSTSRIPNAINVRSFTTRSLRVSIFKVLRRPSELLARLRLFHLADGLPVPSIASILECGPEPQKADGREGR